MVADANVFVFIKIHVGRAAVASLFCQVIVFMGWAEWSAGATISIPELVWGALDALVVEGVMIPNCAFFALIVGDGGLPPGLVVGALDADVVFEVFELVGGIAVDALVFEEILVSAAGGEVNILNSLGRNDEEESKKCQGNS